MNIELILAAGLISFLLMYFANAIKQEDGHFLLRYLSYSIGIILLIIVAKGAIDSTTSCELVLNNTIENTSVSNITTTLHEYATVCYENTQSTSSNVLYKIASWVFILYIAYVMIYLIYWLFMRVQSWWRKR